MGEGEALNYSEWLRVVRLIDCPCSKPDGKDCKWATFSKPNAYPCPCVCHKKAKES